MKFLKTFLLLLIAGFLLNSCELEPDHSIRIDNQYAQTFKNVSIGDTEYGTVAAGTMTDYKSVAEGSSTLSGSSDEGTTLSVSVSVTGDGEHNWTLTISASGDISISED